MTNNSVVSCRIWLKLELIQGFRHVLVSCKNEEVRIKNEGARVVTTFSSIVSLCGFFRHSTAANSTVHGRIRANFILVGNFIGVLVTCKNKEDPIKNEGARVLTTLYIAFSDAQGQLTPQSVVGFGRISNSFVLL